MQADLAPTVMVDCSHGNSLDANASDRKGANGKKDPLNQLSVARSVVAQRQAGNQGIRGIMLESHLHGGRQGISDAANRDYGVSITDACLSFEDTESLLRELAEIID